MRTMKSITGWAAAAALAAIGLAAPAEAQQPAPAAAGGAAKLSGPDLYQQRTCVACHGKDAKTPLLPEYPKLAGQNAEYMKRQMHDIKSGARSNGNTPAMKGIMHLVTDEEIAVLATWLSTLK